MTNENDLIEKLMISKAIMDKHNNTPRAGNNLNMTSPTVENYEAPQAKYNLPQEFMQESVTQSSPSHQQPITKDRVMSSKLPDEIKRLMIEHPINQPNSMAGPSLSNDLIDKASRLMNLDAKGSPKGHQPNRMVEQSIPTQDLSTLKELLREVVEEVLQENGLIAESTQKSNEIFSFKVGKHIFEGKVTKIKKIA
jgi:hypothetical protein